MAIDIEALRSQIEEFFVGSTLIPFYGLASYSDQTTVYWDIKREPDFQAFLKTAEKASVKLIVVHHERFLLDEIDDVRDQIEDSTLSVDEKRNLEIRIQEIQKFEGFTSRLELSFSLDGRTYIYHVEADWYRVWDDILLELDAAEQDSQEIDGDAISGYYSAN